MPCLHQSVWRAVRRPSSKDFTPSLILARISCLDYSNSFVSDSSQKKVRLGFIKLRNGSMIGLREYAQDTWFTNPNHERALVRSVGTGKSDMAAKMALAGVIPSLFMVSPANSTSSRQNWSFSSLMVTPFWAHRVR